MGRMEDFYTFIDKFEGKSYRVDNVVRILYNLKRADEDGRLWDFLMNKKPYKSSFAFVEKINEDSGYPAARKKDQVAIVVALNLYGAVNPGFKQRLNAELKRLASGSVKGKNNVLVLTASQLEFQEKEISLINFMDRELYIMVDKYIRTKTWQILLSLLMIVGGAIGMPGFSMIGLIPLSLLSIVSFIYGIGRLIKWIAIPKFDQEYISKSLRNVGYCLTADDEKELAEVREILHESAAVDEKVAQISDDKKQCVQCREHLESKDKFCGYCGAEQDVL